MADLDPTIDKDDQRASFDVGGGFAPDLAGSQFGRYRIKRLIASGGMGSVYEAIQDQPRRTVALKVMKPGLASRSALRRFEYESQLLARLRHPGIAEVYDAGTHEERGVGVPYFVMEYISRAKRITDYVREKKLGTRQRLELFIKVCQAVHHGHTKGIIHRDLKPDNILIDSHNQPKIIDFGVARATDSDMAVATLQTDIGQLIGTLQYMSPEQVDADPNDLDTRSDVYSLGVVLYELLCEKLPYDVTKAQVFEATRIIREQQAMRLSTVDAALRGDIETIVVKALEKDRERRYQSAQELAADIGRYLNDEPITARPPSLTYQLRVFARRNKTLIGAVCAVFVALCIGLVTTSVMYFRAEGLRWKAVQAQGVAERKTDEAEQQRKAANEQRELALVLGKRADANAEQAETEAKRATEQRQKADEARRTAVALKEETRRRLYIADMNRASQAYDDGDIDHMNDLLVNHIPKSGEADLRGFEWYYWWRAEHLEQVSFRNLSTGPFRRLAASPDGKTVAATGFPNSIYLFDRAEARMLRSPLQNTPPDLHVSAFSPDGALLLAGNPFDGSIRAFRTSDWNLTKTLQAPGGVESLAFSPTEPLMASGGRGRRIVLWHTATWLQVANWPAQGFVRSLAFSPDGTRLVAGMDGATVVVWDVASRKVVRTHDAHKKRVTSVAFSPDGSVLATGSEDETVRLWNQQLDPIDELSPLVPITSLAFSPDGKHLVAGTARTNSVLVWNMESHPPALIANVKGHSRPITGLAFVGDVTTLWSASEDGFIKVWDLSRCTPYDTVSNVADSAPLAYAADGRTLLFNDQGAVGRWDVTGRTLLPPLNGGAKYSNVGVSGDGAVLAGLTREGELRVWDAAGDPLPFEPTVSPQGISGIAIARNGQTVAYDDGQTIVVRDMASGATKNIPGRGSPVFSPDGKLLVALGQPQFYQSTVWDVTADPPTRRYVVGGWGAEMCAAFSPDGATLAIGSYNNDIRLYDADKGKLTHTLRGHTEQVNAVAFSSDGRRLVSGSNDGTVRIWNPGTGELLSTFEGHGGAVRCVAFAPDGTSVASSSDDGTARIWDARSAYAEEGSPLLLPGLDRKVADGTATAEDFKLRGLIHARQGEWDKAAAEFDRAALLTTGEAELPLAFQTPWWIVGDYPGDLQKPFAPETDPDPLKPVARPTGDAAETEMVSWSPGVDVKASGVDRKASGVDPNATTLNLGAYCENRDHVTAYALTRFYTPRERKVGILIAYDDQLRLWLDGELIYEQAGFRSVNAGDDVVEVTLNPGWNTLLAKVVNMIGNHALIVHLSDNPEEIAEAYERAEQWPEALRLWTRVLDDDPQEVRMRLRRAGAALRANNYELAAKDFALVIEQMEDQALARSLVEEEFTKHFTGNAPLELFTQAVALLPDNSTFRIQRAQAYIRHQRWQEAAADLTKALELNPDNLDALDHVLDNVISRPLVSSSQTQPVLWRYTFRNPGQGWQNADFDDADWQIGPAPFGGWGDPNTTWSGTTPDIWLRKEFVLSEAAEAPMFFRAFSDDHAEIYLNALPAAQPQWADSQYRLYYQELACDAAAARGLQSGRNVLAVHCLNDDREGRIDVGLYRVERSDQDAVLGILSQALEAHPNHRSLLDRRSQEYIRRAMWSEAAADLTKIVELDPDDNMNWLRAAPLLALAGNKDAYLQHARRMAAQFAADNRLAVNEQVTKVGLLLPDVVPVSQLPLSRYTDALDDGSAEDWFLPYAFGSRALASYRAGDARQALHWVPKARESQGTASNRAMCLVIQALAQHQLGKLNEARQPFKQATELIDAALAQIKNGNMAEWNDWLYAEVLRREAETLISGHAP